MPDAPPSRNLPPNAPDPIVLTAYRLVIAVFDIAARRQAELVQSKSSDIPVQALTAETLAAVRAKLLLAMGGAADELEVPK